MVGPEGCTPRIKPGGKKKETDERGWGWGEGRDGEKKASRSRNLGRFVNENDEAGYAEACERVKVPRDKHSGGEECNANETRLALSRAERGRKARSGGTGNVGVELPW